MESAFRKPQLSQELGSVVINANLGWLRAKENVPQIWKKIVRVFAKRKTSLQATCATMSVSLKKHPVEALVQMSWRYFVMANARRGLCNVTVNVWMNYISLQTVMEPAQDISLKIGGAILFVSLLKNLAMEHAWKVNLG
jgi:hypothetical protein